jgi:hypothetical protein
MGRGQAHKGQSGLNRAFACAQEEANGDDLGLGVAKGLCEGPSRLGP